ncbi:MAG: branched-chain-amino-acid transaminase [Candidatus Sungbacteria bacterium RIFCSPLOWO2_02_FULL_51_17]|uniref:Branched-chain-amino-acid aminotransferase n=1 Tax=Candidatus Sungbacteria bacterium RIFCSPHIGHO2_02_FULL_51_29 TaxID=1802273 RepID=A0A1G2KQM2_9BACT|nr:MAG: branched-chain-amino-acid transaminase [Candidatus Sungbacteria bacterium RIFCSPHIGHO2_01_FULL_51_22]OHA01727.1 MAG: branched-chain-amino-acid transaminase [Candidatus Sungbacteria bacterium RIFCSPHIGHO2_02_FULL_51_29]OHA05806.1 MAG: branched-chain-amino-acid transaminase [Candidatus Sungbacteria bacterium RIFCSPLOWO2_01_FULL_51_34]OHA11413.1 MAG: branched-chain-amino-acid transaminase [Candidatus Sungbacteria bacterium RIFCSPLOWO2_02_FULL_51_17]
MKPAQKIFLNGRIAPLNKAHAPMFHQGLNYGACVYEGIRVYRTPQGPAVFRLQEHLDRFFYSASVLAMNLGMNKKEFAHTIENVVKANAISSGYIRPMAFYSEAKMGINIIGAKLTIVVFAWPWKDAPPNRAMTMKIVHTRRLDPSTVDLRAKISGYYANGLLGFLEAKKAGCDEPLFLDTHGFLAEGAVNNIFIVKRKTLYTPARGTILGGVTRDTVITLARDMGVIVQEKRIRPEFLRTADEVFLTGTGIELERVRSIPGYFSERHKTASIMAIIEQQYRKVTCGDAPRYRRWLTPIR